MFLHVPHTLGICMQFVLNILEILWSLPEQSHMLYHPKQNICMYMYLGVTHYTRLFAHCTEIVLWILSFCVCLHTRVS